MGNRQDLDATPTRALNIVRFGLLGLAVVIVGGMRLVLHGAARWRGDPAPATNQIKAAGRPSQGQHPLYSSWEDMLVVVAGTRTMKSTA